ncbi:hypothetical protein GO491_02290 [Flavobacteriaceae bacterium Ap0902]|nr:hypothetical protein [Flavobacteriaceae bacterium Ap0902]
MIFFLMVLLVLYGTITPLNELSSRFDLSFIEHPDKIVHMLMFVILGFFIVPSFPKINPILLAFILSGFGYLTELLQHWLPTGRTFEFYDWVADSFGVIIGFIVYRVYNSLILKNKKP